MAVFGVFLLIVILIYLPESHPPSKRISAAFLKVVGKYKNPPKQPAPCRLFPGNRHFHCRFFRFCFVFPVYFDRFSRTNAAAVRTNVCRGRCRLWCRIVRVGTHRQSHGDRQDHHRRDCPGACRCMSAGCFIGDHAVEWRQYRRADGFRLDWIWFGFPRIAKREPLPIILRWPAPLPPPRDLLRCS